MKNYARCIFNEEINWTGEKSPLSHNTKVELFDHAVSDQLGYQLILSDTLLDEEVKSWKTVADCVAAAEEAVTGYLEIKELDTQLGV